MKSKLATALVVLAAGSSALGAQATPSPALVALSKTDLTLAIVDPATLKVVGKVPSGPDPHEVVVSADGREAYISNYGGGAYHTLTVIDLVNRKSLRTVELGALRGPHGLDVAGGKIWFTAEAAKAIGSYDPVTNQVDLILGTGQTGTHMIAVWNEHGNMVTSNIGSASLTFFEPVMRAGRGAGSAPQRDWNEIVVAVGRGVEGFDFSPGGRELWVANAQDGTISVIDPVSKTVTATLTANVSGANRLKFTPDGKLVFVSMLRSSDVAIFDATTRRELRRVQVGRGAAGIQMQPDGRRVFVACTPDDYIAVIDLTSLEVVGRLDVGHQPDGMAWAVHR